MGVLKSNNKDVFKRLNNIYSKVQFLKGDEYLRVLIKSLAEELDIEYAYIGIPTKECSSTIKTSFAFFSGEFIEDFEYNLADTPCENPIGEQRVYVFPDKLKSSFPNDPYIDQFKIKSYIGCPFYSADNELIGLLVVMDINKIQDIESYRSICEFFSNMIGVEIARKNADEKLINFNKELEQKVIEKTLIIRRSSEAMLEQEKLASLGRFMAGISHEIRNPLNLIVNSSIVANENVGELILSLDTRQKTENEDILISINKTHELIDKNCDRIKTLINKMMRQGREREILESYEITTIVNEAIDLAIQASDLNKASIDIDIFKNVPKEEIYLPLTSDILSLFLNLFENALSALYVSQIKTERKEKGKLKVTIKEESRSVSIKIYDNGTGISDQTKIRVFEPFFTTKEPTKGAGLGLWIVKSIVDQNNGKIIVESEEGKYTEFCVHLPKQYID